MIVPMRKVYLVARHSDREQLLNTLRELGIVHLVPVDPARAVPDEATKRQIELLQQALQDLSGVAPRGTAPEISALEAAREVLEIRRRSAEGRNHLAALHHQLEEIAVWDDLRLKDLEDLRQAGIDLRFYAIPGYAFDQVEAECVAEVGHLTDHQIMVAVADRSGQITLPVEATLMRLPSRDAATIRSEAKTVDQALHQDLERLHALAGMTSAMETQLWQLEQQAEQTVAELGAATDDALFAVQGWLPAENVKALDRRLAANDIPVLLEIMEPSEGEQPPTLVRPPIWARPIEGLFKILGTVPGYREFDVSTPFLIALPIFTAMLISDAGYGAVLLLGPALSYAWATRTFGKRFTQLLMLIGAISLIWGILTNAFFGLSLLPVTVIPIELTEASRQFMMRLSFLMGATHLSLAKLWQAVRYYPDLRWLNRFGWALFIWGMYGVVNMFVLQGPMTWQTPWPHLLLAGSTLAILFAKPSANYLKTLGTGLADFPLSMLSAFSDVISYVRLMAVGLASSVLAVSFNEMAFEIGIWPLTVLVLLVGHGLNIGLAMIAMFAHGVRLNMLEFCSNLDMEWAGYPYKPFANRVR
jgi:V/A-type H+-transporting ATPase subunit I